MIANVQNSIIYDIFACDMVNFGLLRILRRASFIFLSLFFVCCTHQRVYKIGVSQCSEDDWRMKMNGEIAREMMFHPEAVVEIRSAGDDSERQIADIDYFLNNGFDIIVVAPNEAEALTPAVKKAYERGVPVVVFDRKIIGDTYTAFQGADNEDIGRRAARQALAETPAGTKMLEIYGLAGSTPAMGRHKGFFEEIAAVRDTSDISTIYGDWNYEDTRKRVAVFLENNPDVGLIYAHNDRMAIAASDVARQKGIHPYIIGIDAAPSIGMKAVKDGRIDATFLYPTEGARLINTALDILNGKEFERFVEMPSSAPVTVHTVDVLLRQNEELNTETSHLEQLKAQLDDYWDRHSAQNVLLGAAIVIILLLFVVIFGVLRAIWSHKRNRQELAKRAEQLESQKNELIELNSKLHEATQSKLVFFTNVSHDLRTPLTLIAEPVAQLAGADNLTASQKEYVKIADKNIRILKRLINQILDFRKYENNKMEIELSEVDLGKLIEEWATSFGALARKRHIKLDLHIDADAPEHMAVDVEKIERVFFNLVSNAFKYTPDNGTITVDFKPVDDGNKILLSLADTGRGISEADLVHIFDRFYTVEHVNPNGSGIGLALVKAFVELHDGTISVESTPGKGTIFTIELPVRHVDKEALDSGDASLAADVMAALDSIDENDEELKPGKPRVLVIDDNEDIRRLIGRLLADEYTVLRAANGKEGLRIAARYVPDAIVCDVMMPEMDGLECCRRLKGEVSTSHVPVLMLTACSMDEQRVAGLESGADAYVAKPFSAEVLLAQLRALMANRKLIRDLWGKTKVEPKEQERDALPQGAVESDFYRRFVELVEAKMSNPDLGVDNLAADMGLTRSQFYRKIKALTNFSPVELIRQMRLRKSREMLTSTEKTVSEIGYEVGFSSAAYFTKCYRDEYGETPSQLRERLGMQK